MPKKGKEKGGGLKMGEGDTKKKKTSDKTGAQNEKITSAGGGGGKHKKHSSGGSDGGIGSHTKSNGFDQKSHELVREISETSTDSKGNLRKKKKLNTESAAYIGIEPEWNTIDLRKEEMESDGFTCCIVMIIEESLLLTEYINFLHQAVNTGIRKKFASIDGNSIVQKVKKYMTSTNLRKPGIDDETHLDRIDIWAEAIKHTLLEYKRYAITDLVSKAKQEIEITGARSKELFPPLTAFTSAKGGGASEPTLNKNDLQIQNSVPTTATGGKLVGPDKNKSKIETEKNKQGKIKKKDNVSLSMAIEKQNVSDLGGKPKPTLLKKRGEIPMPIFDFVEDTPIKGPHSFFLLQGFYNPLLIQELKAIGVRVDGILLMTAGILTKRNFSVLDIEENIPGTFKPHNMLPDYAKMLGKHSTSQNHDLVAQFWSEFADMLNHAKPNSEIHDIALLNCPLPSLDPIPISMEQKGLFAASLFDEASKRIYEMLVLNEWFQKYKSATITKELVPLAEPYSQVVYEHLINQVPAECVTVALIVECMVEQVAVTMDAKGLGHGRGGKPGQVKKHMEEKQAEWGITNHRTPGMSSSSDNPTSPVPTALSKNSSLPIPLYIKSCDFASMRSCHLNENFAAHIASTQVCGDLHNIQNFLWDKMPEFNKGLYMKLLSNLNHFMNFLPEEAIKFEDMFFILHLLMAAGVELHLQKQAESIAQAETKERNKSVLTTNQQQVYPHNTESMESLANISLLHGPGVSDYSSTLDHQLYQGNFLPGTSLKSDHNYLALADNSKVRFIMAPSSNAKLVNITPLGIMAEDDMGHLESEKLIELKNEEEREKEEDKNDHEKLQLEVLENQKQPSFSSKSQEGVEHSEEHYQENEAVQLGSHDIHSSNQHIKKLRKSMGALILAHSIERVEIDPADQLHAAVVATVGTIDTAVNFQNEEALPVIVVDTDSTSNYSHPYTMEQTDNPTPPNTPTPTGSKGQIEEEIIPIQKQGFVWGYHDEGAKRFIACEEEWFNSISDYSVLEALLKCPALLAISESGALDLSSWIESYLFCSGLSRAAGEGHVIGDLKNWTFVEEYVSLQMIQVLSAAATSYMCMERMYCPFYDTLLFIFNNPTPSSLKAESQFYCKLKTLPGLQHFLEYTINDDNVLEWLLDLERSKGVEAVDSFSVTTLMRLVPEEQWMLIPSIKWTILREQKEREEVARRSAAEESSLQSAGDGQSEHKDASDDEFGRLKKEKRKKTGKGSGSNHSVEKHNSQTKRRSRSSEKSIKSKGQSDSSVQRKEEQKLSKPRKKSGDKNVRQGTATQKSDTEEDKYKKAKSSDPFKPLLHTDTDDSVPFKNALGDLEELNSKPSFNFTDAVKGSMGVPTTAVTVSTASKPRVTRFDCYDLGKRVLTAESDMYHLFPLDGTIISYEICTIDPDFRMMQLSISKNSHQTYFYPYYIPHDLDLSTESYVVCPYFHMVHSNGTIFAFQDLRTEGAPYIRLAMKQNYPQPGGVFSNEDIHFAGHPNSPILSAEEIPGHTSATDIAAIGSNTALEEIEFRHSLNEFELENLEDSEFEDTEYEEEHPRGSVLTDAISPPGELKDVTVKGKLKKGKSGKKDKTKEKEKEKEEEKPDKKKGKQKKGKGKGKGGQDENRDDKLRMMEHSYDVNGDTTGDISGEWKYLSSENTDAEDEHSKWAANEEKDNSWEWMEGYEDTYEIIQQRKKHYQFSWEYADKLIDEMSHSFKITLPSGLFIQVEDIKGVPLTREVKQCYLAKGSASSLIEDSRYYTCNGSVVKFMLNRTIQILTARGVTTNIRELSINMDKDHNEVPDAFALASRVEIFNGDVILPSGEFWHIVNGNKVNHRPFYVFTSGMMPNGEVFRRRQDGVTYLHRHDGTVITHYPDGTRFTTRMIVLKDPVEDFEDWVFVGLKFMIEHPNYATVLFNTLSGNVHIRTTPGEWVRVFADGSIKVGTKDDFKLDVDKYRAIISSPASVVNGEKDSPNLTAVKLYHAHEYFLPQATTHKPKTAYESLSASYAREHELAEEEETTSFNTSSIESQGSMSVNTKAKKTKGPRPKKSGKTSVQKPKQQTTTVETDLRPTMSTMLLKRISSNSIDRVRSNKSISLEEAEEMNNEYHTNKKENEHHNTIPRTKFEIEGLLTFSDMWTVCRAIDSWDNRFAVDLFGDTTVDKGLILNTKVSCSNEELIRTLSSHFQLPKQFLSGILSTTSSENLSTCAKRIGELTKPAPGNSSCNSMFKTKIFVVRRDLSGYEYLKKTDVNKIILNAKNCKNATCIIEPLPNQLLENIPRNLLTIMEPIDIQINTPHGIWKSDYREPVFKPRSLANKHLQMARPEDLRWFGYILASAHTRRPSFFLSPRKTFIKSKILKDTPTSGIYSTRRKSKPVELVAQDQQSLAGEELRSEMVLLENSNRPKSDEGKKKKSDGKKDKTKKGDEKQQDNTEVNNSDKKDKKGKKKPGRSDSVEKKKPIEPEKSKSSYGKNMSDTKTDKRLSKAPSSKTSRPNRLSKQSEIFQNDDVLNNSTDLVKTEVDIDTNVDENAKRKVKNSTLINLDEVEIGEYRDNIPDIAGLYGIELPEEKAIKAQFHPDNVPPKKAIIVRSIVEIPKVDNKMQRALLAASMSYSKTIDNHKKIYESYEMRDPRPEDEKIRQKIVKQHLIEQNLGKMHLFEQKEGNLLQFNL